MAFQIGTRAGHFSFETAPPEIKTAPPEIETAPQENYTLTPKFGIDQKRDLDFQQCSLILVGALSRVPRWLTLRGESINKSGNGTGLKGLKSPPSNQNQIYIPRKKLYKIQTI